MPQGRPKGDKNKMTRVVERVIGQVVPKDDEQSARMMRRFFAGAIMKPPEWWKQLGVVVAEVQQQAALLKDKNAVYVTTLDGPGRGGISLATAAHATKLICEKSHRLSTAQEIDALGERRLSNDRLREQAAQRSNEQ